MYRKFLRPGWIFGHLMVVVAVLVCLRLGLWQWHRTEHGGTVQNLGYTILWPIFGAAFVYMWFRFLQLETLKDAEDEAELTAMAAGDGLQLSADELTADRSAPPAAAPAGVDATFDPPLRAKTDHTPLDVLSSTTATTAGDLRPAEVVTDLAPVAPVSPRSPSRGITVASATVGDADEDDDPELAAYNRALADLAAKDHRRAR